MVSRYRRSHTRIDPDKKDPQIRPNPIAQAQVRPIGLYKPFLKFSRHIAPESVHRAAIPRLFKEGWLRDQENIAKPRQLAQTGWLIQATDYR